MRASAFLLVIAVFAASCSPSAQSDGMEALKAQYDFAVTDTASITKIVISDKKPASVTLQRTTSGWVVGDSLPVRTDAVEVLLQTVGSVTLKNFVKKSAIDQVNNRMDVYGKWVEVYAGDQLVKSYIVGTETPDMLGTYFRMTDSQLPFSVYIQGFNGYLTTRFFTEESLWRERTMYGLQPNQIEAVEMNVTGPEGFFWIITRKDLELGLLEPATEPANWSLVGGEYEPLAFSNPQQLLSTVQSLRTLKYEGAIVPTDNIWQKKDSIFASTPAFTMNIHTVDGDVLETQAFFKKPEGILIGEDGVPHQWDPDRFYAKLPDGRMALIQRYAWRNLMKTPWEFNQ